MKKVLITGITGFLGSHVASLCLRSGYAVRGAVQDLKDKSRFSYLEHLQRTTGKKIELVEASLENYYSWDAAAEGCKSIIHLAAPLVGNIEKIDEIESTILRGTQAILEYSEKHGIDNIVMTGTALNTGIYSKEYTKRTYTEDDWADTELDSGYLRGKAKMEKFAWEYHKNKKYALTFIHPAIIYGPILHNDISGSVSQLLGMFKRRLAYFHLSLPISDVRDVALAHVKALENPSICNGKRYLCSGGSLWLDEIPSILEAELGKYGYTFKKYPKGSLIMKIAGILRPEARRLIKNEGLEYEISSELIKQDLGITFRDPKETVISTVYSFIDNKVIPDLISNKLTHL